MAQCYSVWVGPDCILGPEMQGNGRGWGGPRTDCTACFLHGTRGPGMQGAICTGLTDERRPEVCHFPKWTTEQRSPDSLSVSSD